MSLSMLLDVLVLGHLCLVRGPRALSAVALQQAALTETHGERWLLLPLMHAYAIAVVTSYVRCTSGQASSVRGKDTACRRAIIED